MQYLPRRRAGSFSEDRPLGWDPVAEGNRAGDGMARFVSEEKLPARWEPLLYLGSAPSKPRRFPSGLASPFSLAVS